MMQNKKGLATYAVLGIIALILLAVYGITYFLANVNINFGIGTISFPAIKTIFASVNYVFMLMVWILIQVAIIYGAYKGVRYLIRGFGTFKQLFQQKLIKVEQFILK
jgi:uncharacterized integral membrane protein